MAATNILSVVAAALYSRWHQIQPRRWHLLLLPADVMRVRCCMHCQTRA